MFESYSTGDDFIRSIGGTQRGYKAYLALDGHIVVTAEYGKATLQMVVEEIQEKRPDAKLLEIRPI